MSEAPKGLGWAGGRGLFIGRYFEIEFYLHFSWFLIAAALCYTLAADIFPPVVKLPRSGYALMGLTGSLLFFLSIILHELGHSLVSQRCGIPVPRITLLFIGGIAEISREPDNARSELLIALGGPIVSVFLSGCFGLAAWLCHLGHYLAPSAVLGWLSLVNLVLVVFNMIPGYPLDGGRILRALLWAHSGKLRRATYITSRIGIGFSWVLLALGLFRVLVLHDWLGVAPVIIAMFLKGAAESGYTHAVEKEVLGGVQVRDLMTPQPVCIPAELPLNLVVDEYFLTNHHVAFPVVGDEGEFRGMLRLEFLKNVAREKWPYQSAGDLAAERETSTFHVAATATAARAMRSLLSAETGRLAVTEGDKVVGIVTRHDILQFIKIHTELEA